MASSRTLLQKDHVFLLMFIFLVSLNLRGPVTGLPPLFERINIDLNLNSSQTGLLTSLPLIIFAVFAPIAAWFSQRYQTERILALGAASIVFGMIIRTWGMASTLYIGVIFIGIGIAIGNALLPSLLKRHFANHIVQLTAVYVLMMNLGGFLMSSSAVPLSLFATHTIFPLSDWAFALLCQAAIATLPFLIWFSGKITIHPMLPAIKNAQSASIWRSVTAWQVSSFLAFNSLISYSVMTWVPSILINNGYSDTTAGLYQGYLQLGGALPSLILAPFIHKLGSHRQLCLFATSLSWVSIFGFLAIPAGSGFWSVLFGFGTSMTFILGLSFISFRTDSPKQAAALAGMSQLIGYMLAAIGPVFLGFLYDKNGSWTAPLYVLLGLCSIWIFLGWFASPKPQK